jgi:hypothetical protein
MSLLIFLSGKDIEEEANHMQKWFVVGLPCCGSWPDVHNNYTNAKLTEFILGAFHIREEVH